MGLKEVQSPHVVVNVHNTLVGMPKLHLRQV